VPDEGQSQRKDAIKIIAFAVALAVLSPSAFAGDHKAQIQGYADAWMAAYNNHDVASLAKMYTDDAEMSWPTGSESGKAAILEAFKKDFATNAMKFNSILTDTAELSPSHTGPGRPPRRGRTATSSRSRGTGR